MNWVVRRGGLGSAAPDSDRSAMGVENGTAPAGTVVRQHPERASYDREVVEAILDEALFCHIGFVSVDRPFVIPCIHARIGDSLYLHGAVGSRLMGAISSGAPLCITATLLDGLVLARSWFSHSMNYRSVVLFGPGREVVDLVEKSRALRAIVEHVTPGRSRDARPPSPKEMAVTKVVAVQIEQASAKIRRGLPRDRDEDYELPVWAGEVPLRIVPLPPVADPRNPDTVRMPSYVRNYHRPGVAPTIFGG
jgi:uncharacterized protein